MIMLLTTQSVIFKIQYAKFTKVSKYIKAHLAFYPYTNPNKIQLNKKYES